MTRILGFLAYITVFFLIGFLLGQIARQLFGG